MVTIALQDAVTALSVAEKVKLRDFLDVSLDGATPALTDQQKSIVRSRAAELDADPSLAVPWEDVNTQLIAEFG